MMARGDAWEGKWRGNWQMEWVASALYTTSEHGVSNVTTAGAHTSAASIRLNWPPPPFRWFKWTCPFCRTTKSGFYACAINFKRSLPNHKIPFCYVICIITFVSRSCVIVNHLHQFSCILWEWHWHTHLVCKLCWRFFWRCCQSCTNFIHFFPPPNLSCVHGMFSYCLKWNQMPQIFLFICTLFLCMDLAHPEIFMWIYYGISCSNCVWIMYHTEICPQTANES
jgi:hypothetical protein